MGWFGDDSNQAQAYNDIKNVDDVQDDHKAKFSHEFIGGAAAYEAMKAYENHCAQNGDPQSHAEAKEIAAGFAGAFVDRFAETKGEDWYDREEAKRSAQNQVNQAIDDNGYQQQQY